MTNLYETILGDRYATLPRRVQELHRLDGSSLWRGHAVVGRGTGCAVNIFADLLFLPRAAERTDVAVSFVAKHNREIWDRRFGGRRFRSVQWQKDGILYERLFLTTLVFDIVVTVDGLDLVLRDVRVLGLPAQWLLRADVVAREREKEGRFHFYVRVTLPLLGLLVEYDGTLEQAA